MKKLTSISILTILLTCCNLVYAQDLKTFPTNCEPTEISADQAAIESRELIQTCGFGSVFISRLDIEDLLKTEKCVGIRFYISMESGGQKYADVIAVAIDETGQEIGNNFQRTYLMVKSLDEKSYPAYARGLNVYEAERCVSNLSGGKSGLDPYVGYLGSETLRSLLEQECDGIRVYPSEVRIDDKTYHSMSYGAAKTSDGEILDVYDVYYQAMHPCPTDCGGDGDKNYLWNSKD